MIVVIDNYLQQGKMLSDSLGMCVCQFVKRITQTFVVWPIAGETIKKGLTFDSDQDHKPNPRYRL